ncbi:hypothetical protein PAMC26577_14055 [Caballeronia sordidicola]|uniref:Uncharacterized protein n=1 Tax=Caballeronia sordidicola TaxID=196367 RepID=A0A242MUI0_CABSO|nr:hypothetical protein PAMC26577_14055 [Caballeronia sordidicola]
MDDRANGQRIEPTNASGIVRLLLPTPALKVKCTLTPGLGGSYLSLASITLQLQIKQGLPRI